MVLLRSGDLRWTWELQHYDTCSVELLYKQLEIFFPQVSSDPESESDSDGTCWNYRGSHDRSQKLWQIRHLDLKMGIFHIRIDSAFMDFILLMGFSVFLFPVCLWDDIRLPHVCIKLKRTKNWAKKKIWPVMREKNKKKFLGRKPMNWFSPKEEESPVRILKYCS